VRALLLLGVLPGCSLLFAPSDLMGGDAGGGPRDAGPGVDAPGIDAPGVDAPGTDAGVACVRNYAAGASFDGPGLGPSVTLRSGATVEARVGTVLQSGDVVALEYDLTGTSPGLTGMTVLSEIAAGGGRPVDGAVAVAVRQIGGELRFIIVGTAFGTASGIWVGGTTSGVTNLGAGGPNEQAGPAAIGGGALPRYFWNEAMPGRLIGSLPVTMTSDGSFRLLSTRVPRAPGAFDASEGEMLVAASVDAGVVLVWDGDGADNATSGTGHELSVGSYAVGPVIAQLAGDEYVVAVSEGTELRLAHIGCMAAAGAVTCSAGRTDRSSLELPAVPNDLALVRLPSGGVVVAASYAGRAATVSFLDEALTHVRTLDLDPTARPTAIDLAAISDGATDHLAVAAEAAGELVLSHVIVGCPGL